jgi:hypothetical protein
LINNRQGGRRRGRGGQRGQNIGGRPDGNRQDNRQRGNAAQLLEKYKSMARDSQLAGDRVQTEYYLQFADHYFRVLSESRARFEDQRRQRGEDLDDDEGDEDLMEASDDQGRDDDRDERHDRDDRQDRPERADRGERQGRGDRGDREQRFDRGEQRRRRYSRDERADGDGEDGASAPQLNGNGESIPFDVLPPAIGVAADEPADERSEAAPRPRRRSRAPRTEDGDSEVAPAA